MFYSLWSWLWTVPVEAERGREGWERGRAVRKDSSTAVFTFEGWEVHLMLCWQCRFYLYCSRLVPGFVLLSITDFHGNQDCGCLIQSPCCMMPINYHYDPLGTTSRPMGLCKMWWSFGNVVEADNGIHTVDLQLTWSSAFKDKLSLHARQETGGT